MVAEQLGTPVEGFHRCPRLRAFAQGPFLGLSKLGSRNRITTTRGQTDFQGDLRKPRNENELL